MTTAIRYTHVWIGVQTVLRALGQKQTFRSGMSALPPKADMCGATRHVRFTPESGHVQCNKAMSALCQKRTYSANVISSLSGRRLLSGGSRWRHIQFIGVGSMSCSAAR